MDMNADIEMASTKINPRKVRWSSKCQIQKRKPMQMVRKLKKMGRRGAARTGRPMPTPSLLSLDELVLKKIISNLDVEGITGLAGTCTSMANICSDYVRLHHQALSWTGGVGEQDEIKPEASERVWKFLGVGVKSVKLSHYWNEDDLVSRLIVLGTHCNNLEALTLNNVSIEDKSKFSDPAILNLFSKLKRFDLIQCHWVRWCPFYTLFGDENISLEELSIIKCYRRFSDGHAYPLELNIFECLKKLSVRRCRNLFTNEELGICLEWNGITSLDLRDVNQISLFSERSLINDLIATLDTLVIDYSAFGFDELARLTNLKSLTVYCREDTNIDGTLEKFAINNVVKELFFTRIIISLATINALKLFKHLNSLRLDHCQNTTSFRLFKSLAQHPDLEQFVYAYNNEYTDRDIVRVVETAPKLKRLSLLGGSALRTETYFKIGEIVNSDWLHPTLEIIPPSFITLQSVKDIEGTRRNIRIRNDICQRYCS